MYTFEDDNRCGFDALDNISPQMCCEIICRYVCISTIQQVLDLFISKIEIKCVRVIKVIVCSIVMLMRPKAQTVTDTQLLTIVLGRKNPRK